MSRLRYCLAILFIAFFSSALHAQVAGKLSGSVVDPTGAIIPGATVNLYIAGGAEPVMSATTNESGLFSFTALQPITYDVAIDSAGFTKTTIRSVKVNPLQETGLGVVKLEVAATGTSVEVAADVQTVQLNNAENAATITATQVQNLPVLGRQISVLFQTQTGVASGSDVTSVNGLPSSYTNVTLDGINIQDNYIRTNALDYAPMRTTLDQVAEITVSSSNQGAALGGGASQITLSTKSGSNTYHGALYWYNRNNALAANDWFNNKGGLAKPFLNLNQPGAALGGHIIKDKLFFYVNYEIFRNHVQTPELFSVLTDSAKAGTFKYTDTAGNVQSVNVRNLRNYTPDPSMQNIMKLLPSPNDFTVGDGLNTAGYRFNAQGNEDRNQLVGRGDYYLSSKHSISGTYNYIDNPTLRPDAGSFFTTVPPVSNMIKDHLLSLSWRWTPSATLTNEARGGFMRANTSFIDSNDYPKFIVASAGSMFLNPINNFLNQGRNVGTYNFQDNANWMKGRHEVSFGFQGQILKLMPWNDAGTIPTYTLGLSAANTQSFQASELPGIRSTDLATANNLYANLAGIISQASQTFNVTSKTSGYVPGANNTRNLGYDTYAGYIQDKWKLRPNFTLTVGLRYEYWTPVKEQNSLYLAPVVQGGSAVSALLNPNGTLDYVGSFYKANKANFAPNVGFAWDPFGKGKTSIRGGYMAAYVNQSIMSTMTNILGNNSGLSSGGTLSNQTSLLSAPPTVPTPGFKVPRSYADNYATNQQNAFGLADPNLASPIIHQWTLGIQQEIKGNIINLRYVGNHGAKLLRQIDYNQVLYNANGFLADFLRAQSNLNNTGNAAYQPGVPGSQQLTVFPQLANAALTNSTVQTYLRQGQVGELANYYMINKLNGPISFYPNPNAQSLYMLTNGGSSNYHSAQVEVTRRTRAGLQLQFSYTFSKDLSNISNDSSTNVEPLLDNSNPNLEWARSPYDETHQFKANYYYELPYGKGKHFSGNRVMNAILGDWAISGIWSYHSGQPYSILSTYGTFNRSARSTNTNTASISGVGGSALKDLTDQVFMTGNGPYFISPSLINIKTASNPTGDGRGASQAGTAPFAGQIFSNPNAGMVGNLQRRMFDSPWQWSWDASVLKQVRFGERHKVDLHFDVTNWANHPTFYVYPSQGSYGTSTPFNINSTSFGKFSYMNYNPRVIQLGAYYRF
jgi:hypothetical protein